MTDYVRIMSKITETPWLITPAALATIVDIVQSRIHNGKLSDEELAAKLESDGDGRAANGNSANGGVGVLSLYGPIFGKANLMTMLSGATSLETFQNDLSEMLSNDLVHTIILDMDTPGGTSDGVAETAAMIREGRDVKPIYALADNMIGSAGLWLAAQATQMFSTPSGSVGSLGAYTVHEDQSAADAQRGVKLTYISAGPYKTEGNPHEPLSAEAKEYRQEVIDELYTDFVDAVADGRGVSTEQVLADYGGGRMLTAKKALESGVVDGITTLDKLVSNAQSTKPARLTFAGAGAGGSQATVVGLHTDGRFIVEDGIVKAIGAFLESKDLEHSEPGTGSPPQPVDTHPEDDPAIRNRWRRNPLPVDPALPGAPKPNANAEGGKSVNPELAALYARFGINPDEDEDGTQLNTAVSAALTELDVFKNKGNAPTEKDLSFAKDYPEEHKLLMDNLASTRKTNADAFVESVKFMKRAVGEGDEMKATGHSLSALAMDTVRDSYLKFAEGTGTLEDFVAVVSAITDGGVVKLGEDGSAQPNDEVVLDLTTQDGMRSARDLFAAKVAEIQADPENKDLSYPEAVAAAGKKYPDLAAAYRIALPA